MGGLAPPEVEVISLKRTDTQQKIMKIDPWLQNYASDIRLRMDRHAEVRRALLGDHADLTSFANGYMYYGIHRTETGWVYREWAPGADEMHLIGDFNEWNRESHPMRRVDAGGTWEILLDGADALKHGQRVKVQVTHEGQRFDRIPLYIHKVIQDPSDRSFAGQVWEPEKPFPWTDGGYGRRKIAPLAIYEAHIGMATEDGCIGTYDEFTQNILPRIQKDGYNAVQLMAIMEHPYYASFGYQVSNFFAPSSWYGEPEGLKRLINTAHEMGMLVFLDLVHSHACANTNEGLSMFDGTETQFLRPGAEGWHEAWGSRVFNYGKHEVIHFLLSNIKYWQEEFHFDGFRFDGVTSMIYRNHGLGENFTGYDKYFSLNTDVEAVTYLQLATELIHAINPFAVAIAEDMSGMPGMCLPIRYGGIGFDYRLGMGVPDFWIRMIKSANCSHWNLYEMWHELTTRRPQEKVIGYCESHDQALVGDKTIIFRLADSEMYTGMDRAYHSPVIDRAIALHKMIRFVTLALACDGYLNFMGNEFGHPEWIDFPREGNGYSFHYARRQWSLADNGYLKYSQLLAFDTAMLKFARKYRVMCKRDAENLWIDPNAAVLAFSKGGLIYVFNFHDTNDARDFTLPVHTVGSGTYDVLFTSDERAFGGFGRVDRMERYPSRPTARGESIVLDVPCLTCLVLEKSKKA